MGLPLNNPIQELTDRAGAHAVKEDASARRFTDERPPAAAIPDWMRTADKQPERRLAAAACGYDSVERKYTEATPPMPKRLLSMMSSADRKKYPLTTGFLDYFPDAAAMVAHVSYRGNEKHNPGQPTHWARGKSADHADCIMRHLIERDWLDPDGIEHAAELAWRAMAYLQEMLEKKFGFDLPRGATAPGVELDKVTGR